jgi:predicted porin
LEGYARGLQKAKSFARLAEGGLRLASFGSIQYGLQYHAYIAYSLYNAKLGLIRGV